MAVTWNAKYPTITVELGFASATSGTGIWDTSEWDTGTWGPDTVWTDVTAYVRSISTTRGRQRESDRYDGSASVVFDNRDARFSPSNLSGPYVAAGVSQIRPRVPVRVSATWSSVTYRLFTGRVDAWSDVLPAEGRDALTQITAIDTVGDLARYNGPEQSEQGGGEGSGARVQRILANAGWAWDTNVQPGEISVQATTLAENASTELLLVADSEGGAIWSDPDGALVFEGRHSLLESSRSRTSQATFGASGVPYSAPVFDYSTDTLANVVSLARAGSTQQTASDLESRALYGDVAFSRFDLVALDDSSVAGLAALLLAQRKEPEYRVVGVTCRGVASPSAAWPHLLGRRIRDRVTITGTVPVSGHDFSATAYVEGVSHEITAEREWITSFSFSSTTAYDGFTTSLWDTGTWDDATWFY